MLILNYAVGSGYGENEKSIKKLISDLKLDNNIDYFKTNNILSLLQNSKSLVMASLSEGIPCAMMEAMACQLIVIVPPVGDISDVVEHGINGFIHNNTDEDLTKWMIEAYLKNDFLELMKQNARNTIIKNHSF